jgi:hypothetical protein
MIQQRHLSMMGYLQIHNRQSGLHGAPMGKKARRSANAATFK